MLPQTSGGGGLPKVGGSYGSLDSLNGEKRQEESWNCVVLFEKCDAPEFAPVFRNGYGDSNGWIDGIPFDGEQERDVYSDRFRAF